VDIVTQSSEAIVRRSVDEFYAYLFFGNFATFEEQADQYLRSAGSAWERIYQALEVKCREILRLSLGAANTADLKHKISEYFRPLEEEHLHELVINPIRALFDYFKSKTVELPDVDMKTVRRNLSSGLFDFRNSIVHGRSISVLSFRTGSFDERHAVLDKAIAMTEMLFRTLSAIDSYGQHNR
jgi:hypothetical protein